MNTSERIFHVIFVFEKNCLNFMNWALSSRTWDLANKPERGAWSMGMWTRCWGKVNEANKVQKLYLSCYNVSDHSRVASEWKCLCVCIFFCGEKKNEINEMKIIFNSLYGNSRYETLKTTSRNDECFGGNILIYNCANMNEMNPICCSFLH